MLIYSPLSRCSTAGGGGADTGFTLVGPAKVGACNLFYSLVLKIKNTWLFFVVKIYSYIYYLKRDLNL